MTKLSTGTSFAQLFKKYRLRSEVETLSEFGDLLAEEGFVYETSLFTRWQKGDRVPKERRVLLAILRVFSKRGGIVSIVEANALLQAVNQRDLTYEESSNLSEFLQSSNTKTLPAKPYLFIGREDLLKELTWELINKKKVLLYGMPGVGKTYIAIYLAHQLKNFFPDGIFWFRADIKSFEGILDELLTSFGGVSYLAAEKGQKLVKLVKILEKRNILLILDNCSAVDSEGLKNLLSLPVTVLITSVDKYPFTDLISFRVQTFTEIEFLQLSEKILGKPYLQVYQKKITQLGSKLGFLPISSVISLKQIYIDPVRINDYIERIYENNLSIKEVVYDEKSLYKAINTSFIRLEIKEQEILISCAAFDGGDLSISALAFINNKSITEIKKDMNNLISLSLVEPSSVGRYRLHPIVKEYLLLKVKPEFYLRLVQYFTNKLKKFRSGSDNYIHYFQKEYENILGSQKRVYDLGAYSNVVSLWPLISTYIFYSGNWETMLKLDKLIQSAFKETKDEKGLSLYLLEDLGRVYFFLRRKEELAKLVNSVLKTAVKLKDKEVLGLVKEKIGVIAMSQGSFEKAEQNLLDGIRYLNSCNITEPIAKSYAYLAELEAKRYNDHQSKIYIEKSLQYSKAVKDKVVVAYIYGTLANAYLLIGEFDKSEKLYKASYKYLAERNVLLGEALALEGLGRLYKIIQISKYKNFIIKANKIYKLLGMKQLEV